MQWTFGANEWQYATESNFLIPAQRKLEKRRGQQKSRSKSIIGINVTQATTDENPIQLTEIPGDPLPETKQQSLNPKDQPSEMMKTKTSKRKATTTKA